MSIVDPLHLNKTLEREYYLILTLSEISAKLNSKSVFTVLDFKDGYYQLQLNSEASKLCALNTPFGTYKFLRLPFGLNYVPGLFQKINILYFDRYFR